jgi:hypothetical protein
MHTTPSPLTLTRRHGIAVTAVVVLGVLAMHGLGTHGLTGSHTPVHTPALVTARATATGGHQAMANASSLGDDVGDALAPSQPGDADGMTGLCMAILGLGLALLLLLRARGAAVRWPLPTARWPVVRIPAGRDRDPPTLALLSIRRC